MKEQNWVYCNKYVPIQHLHTHKITNKMLFVSWVIGNAANISLAQWLPGSSRIWSLIHSLEINPGVLKDMFTFSPNPDSYLYEFPLLHICRQHISLEKLYFCHGSTPYENTGVLDNHFVSGDSQSLAFRARELDSVEWWRDILPIAVLYVFTKRCILIQSHWKYLMYTIPSNLSPSVGNIKHSRR